MWERDNAYDFYAARDITMTTLPWPSIARPLTLSVDSGVSNSTKIQIVNVRFVPLSSHRCRQMLRQA
jgi:hypothetical protein